jgi:hypothetical protein
MTDDLITLASAYLDGETTAAERAQVEADAGLLAEVERLRQVRAVLGDTESAPISARERHLAGALDAWDRLPAPERMGDATPVGDDAAGAAGGASITAPTSLRDRRAQRKPLSTRVLTAAAAFVVLAGAGFVVRGALVTGETNDSTASDTADIDESFDAPVSAEFESGPEAAAEETFEQDSEAADDVAVAAVPEVASDAVQGGPEEPPGNDDLEVLSSGAELAEFANAKVISRTMAANEPSADAAESDLAASTADTESTEDSAPDTTLPPPVDLCDLIDEFVGFALWETSGLFDSPIAVGINNTTGEAIAYRDDPCSLIARTPLPTP